MRGRSSLSSKRTRRRSARPSIVCPRRARRGGTGCFKGCLLQVRGPLSATCPMAAPYLLATLLCLERVLRTIRWMDTTSWFARLRNGTTGRRHLATPRAIDSACTKGCPDFHLSTDILHNKGWSPARTGCAPALKPK